MIARSTQSALIALLVLVMVGVITPQSAQAGWRDSHGHRDSGRDYRDNRNSHRHYARPRGHRGRGYDSYYYAPRYYCPDVVVYPREAPRAYYYVPMEPEYPREYGSVGIHLDYNLLY